MTTTSTPRMRAAVLAASTLVFWGNLGKRFIRWAGLSRATTHYADPKIREWPGSQNRRFRAGIRSNRTQEKCKTHGHLWRFDSRTSDIGGWFYCARCNEQQHMRFKYKPHNDKINFRRSDPRHPCYVAPAVVQPLERAA